MFESRLQAVLGRKTSLVCRLKRELQRPTDGLQHSRIHIPRSPIMVLLEFSMFPLDKQESLSFYVARSLDIIDSSGLDYRKDCRGPLHFKVQSVEEKLGRELKG
jgi:hypothetical protein